MTIFQINKRRGHKFIFNGMLFGGSRIPPSLPPSNPLERRLSKKGFCTTRTITCALRIASIAVPSSVRLLLASQIFVAAGILLVFVINLFWAQRVLRAHHPVGWHASLRWAFRGLLITIILTLGVLVTSIVQSYYTKRPRTLTIDRDLQLYGATFFAVVAFLPIPIVLVSFLLSYVSGRQVERFGAGGHGTKIAVLLAGATLCCMGAAFRAGTAWKTPVSLRDTQPAYFRRGWFYVMDLGIDVVIVYMYAVMRVDLRFWIPNGAKGPGSYRAKGREEVECFQLGSSGGSVFEVEGKEDSGQSGGVTGWSPV